MSSADSISSNLTSTYSAKDSLKLQLAQNRQNTTASLLSCLNGGSDSSSLISTIQGSMQDVAELSSVAKSVQEVAKIANQNGCSEAMSGVQEFVKELQSKGTNSTSILLYLNKAKIMAQSDPEGFKALFNGTEATDATNTTDTADAAETTETAETGTDTDSE